MECQEAPLTRLARPDRVAVEGVSAVNGLAEFSGGRIVTVDGREQLIGLIDFEQGIVQAVGKQGPGPEEYQMPADAVGVFSDTTWVLVLGSRELLAVSSRGVIARRVRLPASVGARGLSRLSGMDGTGAVYWDFPVFDQPGPGRMGVAEIFRWRPGEDSATVMRRVTWRDPRYTALSPRDGWGVTRDGWLAVVSALDYHLEWVAPAGDVDRGRPIAFQGVPVTEREREAWHKQRANSGQSAGGPARSGRQAMPRTHPGRLDRHGR